MIAVASLLQGSRGMDWLRDLGRNSIVVFLSFYLPMVAAAKLVWTIGLPIDTGTQAFIVTIFVIAAPVALHQLGKRTLLRFLFGRPSWAGIRRTSTAAIISPGNGPQAWEKPSAARTVTRAG